MASGYYDINAQQHSTLNFHLKIYDDDIPINLTGYFLRLQVRPNNDSGKLYLSISNSGIITGGSTGEFGLSGGVGGVGGVSLNIDELGNGFTGGVLFSADAVSMGYVRAGSWKYSIDAIHSGLSEELLSGQFIVSPKITKLTSNYAPGLTLDANSQIFGNVVYVFGTGATGATGAIPTDYVVSFNGVTGAVTGVTVGGANTFTAANTFSAGITVSGGNLNAVNINTTGFISINNIPATLATTTAGTANVFNTNATSLGIGGAATAITMGAATGTINIRNPTIQVGNTVATITTASGTANTLTVSPYGNFIVSPISTSIVGGTRPSLTVTNSDGAVGTVSISGGDLYLGVKTNDSSTTTPVNVVFEGATTDANETTLTIAEPTADRTSTLPDATGTVALTATSVASFNGFTGGITLAAGTGITFTA